MAVTLTNVSAQHPVEVFGRLKAVVVNALFDDDYATPSTAELTPADVGLAEFFVVLPSVDAGTTAPGTADGAGYVPQYDYESQGLRMFEAGADAAALDEVGDSTGSSAVEGVLVRCVILGV